VLWSWRRSLFQWEEELTEVCEGVILGAVRRIGESDKWQWGNSCYSVKETYTRLSEEEEVDVEWVKEVWNPLIPAKLSILVWRLFQNRLPTKDNLRRRGVHLNSSYLCVGGCGSDENANHIFFNCPMLSIVWKETLKWLGISAAFSEGGLDHLKMFKGLVVGNKKPVQSLVFDAAVVVSHKAVPGMLGSEVIFASSALELLVALARDPIAVAAFSGAFCAF
ncbi:cysteine-rich receptor-like protein kinase, partial [Trifolium medium]|nr:cysteine-rich receptor-like protein kinase [Trifolium medium]